jgi:sugar phosphate isomerase/epimerase
MYRGRRPDQGIAGRRPLEPPYEPSREIVMKTAWNRREFLTTAAGVGAAAGALGLPGPAGAQAPTAGARREPKFKLGLVTYNVGAAFDLPTLLKVLSAAGFAAVEFRTTHAHKVEPDLSADARADVKKRCADAGIVAWGLGSVCEFHSPDPAVVRKHVEDCRQFVKLAADIGARGVKVRPNGLPKNVPVDKTLEQIGKALTECGKAAADAGVEIWVEVHGGGTQDPAAMRKIMDHAAHPAVGVCWNSNPTDVKNGSIAESFELLKKNLLSCHINELVSGYPYRELFAALNGHGYDRYTLNEVGNPVVEAVNAREPQQAVRFLKYYKALWTELARPV